MTNTIKTIGIVGTGVIGAGWAARCLARGMEVIASDPGPSAESQLRQKIDNAEPAMTKLGLQTDGMHQRLRFVEDLDALCGAVDFIQESAPENEDLKRKLHTQLDAATPQHVVIASSSSGLLPSRIQSDCEHPERVVIGHPFNPVYLLPLVEVLGGDRTSNEAIDTAIDFYRRLDMHPLRVRTEVPGYISDRLQEALWREALHMISEGTATTEEIDDAIIYGPGLRWAFMGTCLTFHLAGGDAGMRHMLDQFGPALKLPWTKLEAPDLTEQLIDRMVSGTQAQASGRSVKELERLRDDCLIAIMQALAQFDYAAGRTLPKPIE
ncbi:MAG: L-carnitine dehydrogenase [Arenicellales bacterium]|nr:L-carnitine dehydrogenase [Arenicellales bacterium]